MAAVTSCRLRHAHPYLFSIRLGYTNAYAAGLPSATLALALAPPAGGLALLLPACPSGACVCAEQVWMEPWSYSSMPYDCRSRAAARSGCAMGTW